MIRIKKFRPEKLFENYIDYIWHTSCEEVPNYLREDTIMPLGHMNIIFNLGDPYYFMHEEKKIKMPTISVIGQIKSAKKVQYGIKLSQIGISIKPAAFMLLFEKSSSLYTEAIVEASMVDETLLKIFHEIKDISTLQMQVDLIYAFLNDRIKSYPLIDVDIDEMIAYIERCKGYINIVEMANVFSLSISALERRFKKHMGLTPKTYADIVKFRLTMIEESTHILPLYYDQSHFIKSCKRYTNKTPQQLRMAEREITLGYMLKKR